MPLTVTDLLEPKGPILYAMFPGDKAHGEPLGGPWAALSARVAAYLADAVARVEAAVAVLAERGGAISASAVEDLQRTWVEHRAWRDVYARLVADAAQFTAADGGSRSYLATQITAAAQARDDALARFTAGATPPALSAATPLPYVAASQVARIVW